MDIISSVEKQILGFLKIADWIHMFQTNDFSSMSTIPGFVSHLETIVPFFLFFELIHSLVAGNFKIRNYKFGIISKILNSLTSKVLFVTIVLLLINTFSRYRLFEINISWYSFLYGLLIFELGDYIPHYLSHKVRIFWCIHSIHHIPENMNVSVFYSASFFDNPFNNLIQIPLCIVLGLNPVILFLIIPIHSMWGAFLHVGEGLLKNGRLGIFEKFMITPSHHRVHHSKNTLYLDKNFSTFINIWDRIFGTFQNEQRDMKTEYGITRQMKTTKTMGIYFVEIIELVKDVIHAPGIVNKVKYVFMPPGWSHNGENLTTRFIQEHYIAENQKLSTNG